MKIGRMFSAFTAALTACAVLTQGVHASILFPKAEGEQEHSGFMLCIAELEGKPLSRYEGSGKMGVHDFVLTKEGKTAYETVMDEHSEFKKNVAELIGKNEAYLDVQYDYTAALNGVCFVLTDDEFTDVYDSKKKLGIKKLICFDNDYYDLDTKRLASVSQEEPDYSQLTSKVRELSGLNDTENKGEGMVIAVIDNEFDTSHEYYSMSDDAPRRLTADSVREMRPFMTAGSSFSDRCIVSDKIPFAFDYTGRKFVSVNYAEISHGTHVAGIAAGNSKNVSGDNKKYAPLGTAPEAQLLLMSAGYPDVKGAVYAPAYFAAYDDALYLDADVINASYGLAFRCYDSASDADQIEYEAAENICAAGTVFCSSAGNDHRLEFGEHTDYSSGGLPNQAASVLSVGSIENPAEMKTYVTMTSDGRAIEHGPADSIVTEKADIYDREFEYVPVPGLGYPVDYEGLDLKGKFALINRGVIPFKDKEKEAVKHGAAGIIYINEKGKENVVPYSDGLFSCMISYEDGQALIKSSKKTVLFTKEQRLEISDKLRVNDFSSWDYTETLDLKPDISGFGGNIYSSVTDIKNRNASYAFESGTSMSSPQLAGMNALLLQHIKENKDKYGIVNRSDMTEITAKLLMSTAEPVYYSSSQETASPRVQGNGLANIKNAIDTPCYISTESKRDNCRPKLSLGDGYKDSYTLGFMVTNVSDKKYTYTPKLSLFRDTFDEAGYVDNDLKRFADKTDYTSAFTDESGKKLTKITVKPGETKKVVCSVKLSRAAFDAVKNDGGAFVDGFVRLENEAAPKLTLSFTAYNGEWGRVSDKGLFNSFIYGNIDSMSDKEDHSEISDGEHVMGSDHSGEVFDTVYVSPNGDGIFDTITAALAVNRRCCDLTAEITDSNGNTVYKENLGDGVVTNNEQTGLTDYKIDYDFNDNARDADNAEYTLKLSAKTPLSGEEFSMMQKIVVDTQSPVIKKVGLLYTADSEYYIIEASDNCRITEAASDESIVAPISASESGKYIIIPKSEKNGNYAEVYDAAGNYTAVTDNDVSYELYLDTSDGIYAADDDEEFTIPFEITDRDGNSSDFIVNCDKTPADVSDDNSTADLYVDGFNITDAKALTGRRGDVDLDNEVNVRDAAALAKLLSDSRGDMKSFIDSFAGCLSDHNKDGKVDVRDCASIAKFLAGSRK